MKKNNILLIGFMGTGKTTISALLKEKLNLPEIDMDKLQAFREKFPVLNDADEFERK